MILLDFTEWTLVLVLINSARAKSEKLATIYTLRFIHYTVKRTTHTKRQHKTFL